VSENSLLATLSKKSVVKRGVLEKLGRSRLQEARSLLENKHYSASVYLAGYAVECFLKAAICKAIDSEKMPATFMSHDLDALLLYTGLKRSMQNEKKVYDNFLKIQGIWKIEGTPSLRYKDPSIYKERDAQSFLDLIDGDSHVVFTWLKKQI